LLTAAARRWIYLGTWLPGANFLREAKTSGVVFSSVDARYCPPRFQALSAGQPGSDDSRPRPATLGAGHDALTRPVPARRLPVPNLDSRSPIASETFVLLKKLKLWPPIETVREYRSTFTVTQSAPRRRPCGSWSVYCLRLAVGKRPAARLPSPPVQ